MINKSTCVMLVLVFTLSSCSKNVATATAQVQEKLPIVPTATHTFASEPSETPTPSPPTVTSTATITPTPTATPENFLLANSGYDIADVRISYPRSDIALISFKYRIDETNKLKTNVIGLLPSSLCEGAFTPGDIINRGLLFPVKSHTGSGTLIYKQISQGECVTSGFNLNIYSQFKYYSTWNMESIIVHQEYIDQAVKVTRELPTVNPNTLTIKNVSFQTTGPWTGKLTFDYAFSPDFQDVVGKYRFRLAATSDVLYCDFETTGPFLNNLEGTYSLSINLKSVLSEANGIDCHGKLDQYSSWVYNLAGLSLIDYEAFTIGGNYGSPDLGVEYRYAINLSVKFKKQP